MIRFACLFPSPEPNASPTQTTVHPPVIASSNDVYDGECILVVTHYYVIVHDGGWLEYTN